MSLEFDAIMGRVRHSEDWESWSAVDLLRELCVEKDVDKLTAQLEAHKGRFRTQPMKGLLMGWPMDDDDSPGVWFEALPEFVSLLPKGEKTERFLVLYGDRENLRKINDERAKVQRRREETARKLFSRAEECLDELLWDFRNKY